MALFFNLWKNVNCRVFILFAFCTICPMRYIQSSGQTRWVLTKLKNSASNSLQALVLQKPQTGKFFLINYFVFFSNPRNFQKIVFEIFFLTFPTITTAWGLFFHLQLFTKQKGDNMPDNSLLLHEELQYVLGLVSYKSQKFCQSWLFLNGQESFVLEDFYHTPQTDWTVLKTTVQSPGFIMSVMTDIPQNEVHTSWSTNKMLVDVWC